MPAPIPPPFVPQFPKAHRTANLKLHQKTKRTKMTNQAFLKSLTLSILIITLTQQSPRTAAAVSYRHPPTFHRRQQYIHNSYTHSQTRRQKNKSSPLLVAARSKTKISKKTSSIHNDYPPDLRPHSDDGSDEPSLEEIRASLGPIGRTIAGSVEVGVITAGSYLSGGILGYLLGCTFGVPTLFRSSGKFGLDEVRGRMGAYHSKAATQAGTWASLSAAFSGFHAACRVIRGGKEDKWNGIWGSAATGAYLSRQGGPQAMIQGASTYAGITYILDMAFGSSNTQKNPMMDREYEIDEEYVR
mmetsp:Transcript_25336/g.30675  ORF Transcript_25336/g.30675 Transcript_25336/m.30675 type:complete len:300 (+) Transcript_25336:17-916(+)